MPYEMQEIINDLLDRDIINIKLIPFDEKKQQVERTFKLG
jgi:hypothetical protein